MNRQELSIATISWARNDDEEQVLKLALTQLSKLEIPVYVTDAGSPESFLSFLKSLPHFTLLDTVKGVWPQAKNSINAATAGRPFVLYTEPDKASFFADKLPLMLHAIETSEKTGVVLAARSVRGFATFPAFQQMTETTINRCCTEMIGQEGDYVYGPFLCNSKLVKHLHELPKDIGWGWRPYLFNIAKRLGYSVALYVDDFLCPEDQQEDDAGERMYRMKQMVQNVEGLLLSSRAALG